MNRENRRQLTQQLFQLAYFGHISPEYLSSIDVSEKNFFYDLLVKQKEEENKEAKDQQRKAESQAAAARSKARSPRR